MRRSPVLALAACLLLTAGCAPEAAETPSAPVPRPSVSEAPSSGRVKTDWSQLTPYAPEEHIAARRYEGWTDRLIPAGDYGPLVPFLGDVLGGSRSSGNRYGLVTLSGEVVVDPVFSTVWRGDISGGYHNAAPLPYMMLELGMSSASQDERPEGGGWAMAALDGSWCTEFKYDMDGELAIWGRDINANATEEGLFVTDGSALVYLDGATGRELLRVEDIPPDSLYDALWSARWDGGSAVYCYYDYDAQGTDDYRLVFRADGAGTVRLTKEQAELAMLDYRDGKAIRSLDEGGAEVVDGAGNVLLRTEDGFLYRAWAGGGQFLEYREAYDSGGFQGTEILAVYDGASLERMEESPLAGRLVQFIVVGDFWCWCREGEKLLFFRGDEVETLTWPEDPGDIMWGRVAAFSGAEGSDLVTLDGAVLARSLRDVYGIHGFDRVTGEAYIQLRDGQNLFFYDENGVLTHTFAAAPSENGTLANGLLLVTGADRSGLRDEAGDWLFRWMLPTGEWD